MATFWLNFKSYYFCSLSGVSTANPPALDFLISLEKLKNKLAACYV
jgi:hypothetical protein